MSISPTPSTSFSFYPEIYFEEEQVVPPNAGNEEDQVESSSQPVPLKEHMCAIADRMGYLFYSAWITLPLTMLREFAQAEYEREKREIFSDKPKPFAEIKQRVLGYSEWDLMSWRTQLEKKYIELYR